MPIYEFLCKECRREFKTLRAADKIAEVTCPVCGTPKVARLLSVTAPLHAAPASNGACYAPPSGIG
ncbi:MAG TPA: zinc ribbon domain-containing protein [Chthonomonadaceae bacterium]|nr:zinc ribbon domain-containing protein [Chthonomonadaceae bacterium]